jgi:hypothetical protein
MNILTVASMYSLSYSPLSSPKIHNDVPDHHHLPDYRQTYHLDDWQAVTIPWRTFNTIPAYGGRLDRHSGKTAGTNTYKWVTSPQL